MKKNILESSFFIVLVGLIVKNMPYIQKYDIKLKFSIYRSIMCTFFVINSILFLYSSTNILENSFTFIHELEPLFLKFYLYIIFDIIFTSSRTKKRYDLLVHHIVVLIILTLGQQKKIVGTILPILLINETISILSGFDRIALNNKRINESILFKKIRKIIIIFIRLPIWLLFIKLMLENKKIHKVKILGQSNFFRILYITITLSIIGLDMYWFRKSSKFIKENLSK